jgi:uncharacterized protein
MIWHLIPLSRWRSEPHSGYVPGTRDAAPFVQASPDEQTTLAIANALCAQAAEPLVALALSESALSAPVRYEAGQLAPLPGVAPGTLFPHVYGPLERAAVTGIRYLRQDPSGRYTALEARPATAEALDLLPHPEGGWYRRTWAAEPGPSRPATGAGGPRRPPSTSCCRSASGRAGTRSARTSCGCGTPAAR